MTKKDEMTTAVAPSNGAGTIANYDPDLAAAGMSGDFGRSDVVLPICSLVQPMSQDKGEEGRFWFPDGRSLESLDVVVLDIVATRALWGPIGDGNNGPLCRSGDRRMGSAVNASAVLGPGNGTDPVYIPCAECPHYADAVTFDKSGEARCRFGYTLLLWDLNAEMLFLYFVKGTAVKPVKQRIVSPALMRVQRGQPAAPWGQAYHWSINLVQQPGRKFYVPEITPSYEIDAEDQALYAEMSASNRGRASQQSVEDAPPAEDEGQAAFDA